MKNWYEIIEPHQDIKDGNFDTSVLAADLDAVYSGTAGADYQDPYLFFKKTYLTEGIRHLLNRVEQRLQKGEGDHVLNIQTPFGGGKTHALITLYHYLTSGDNIKGLLPNNVEPFGANMSVIVGTALNAARGNEINGVKPKTLWGILGAQLGGNDGYEFFRKNDENFTPPGKRDLIKFLEKHKPVALLFDEVLQYVNKAHRIQGEGEHLANITIGFFQELTEAVANMDKAIILATLPASESEDFGSQNFGYLRKLQKVFGREEGIETPVKGEEIYEIVRSRLFKKVKSEDIMMGIIDNYCKIYQGLRNQFPSKCINPNYMGQMKKSYPFHPDFIDTLYQKWGTISTFQRTRGVLKLLGLVISDMYVREVNTDLILLGHTNLDNTEIRRSFINHIGERHDGIIDKDIVGSNANAVIIDRENKARHRHLAQKLATSIFLHSFTADTSRSGASIDDVRLASLNADQEIALVGDYLHQLETKLWYMSKDGELYKFTHVPTLTKMIRDRKEAFEQEWKSELSRRLRKREIIGTKFKVLVWPSDSRDIPDSAELKLVLLSPEQGENDVKNFIKKVGERNRIYGNTLIFSIPEEGYITTLKETIKKYLALKDIKREYSTQDMDDPRKREQKQEVESRINKIQEKFSRYIRDVYRIAKINSSTVNLGTPSPGKESISHWYHRELVSEEKILERFDPRLIVRKYLQDKEEVPSIAVKEQFFKNKGLPMVDSENVILQAVVAGVDRNIFGVAYKNGEGEFDEIIIGENFSPAWDEQEYIVSRQKAEEIKEGLAQTQPETPSVSEEEEETEERTNGEEPETEKGGEPEEKKYKNIKYRVSNIPGDVLFDLITGVIRPLSQNSEIIATLELKAESEEGVSEKLITGRVKETLKQLKDRYGINIDTEEVE